MIILSNIIKWKNIPQKISKYPLTKYERIDGLKLNATSTGFLGSNTGLTDFEP